MILLHLLQARWCFKTNCVPCHGEHAQGVVGPNLTDDYWLHGGKINDLFKTVKYGVLTKGMPTWGKGTHAKTDIGCGKLCKIITWHQSA